jgi:alkaline phosphatase D
MTTLPARRAFLIAICALAALAFSSTATHAGEAKVVSRIAFGSCNQARLPQTLWRQVLANKPGVWVWIGDIVYGADGDPADLRAQYALQKSNADYAAVLRSCAVVGTWDDHDYGLNNGGKTYAHKAEGKRLLLDFLDAPMDDPRRGRDGVYVAATFGPPDKRVKIILLDERWFRDEPGPDADMLGEAQWRWLEQQFTDSDAQVHVIGSGSQVIPRQHKYEKWADYPKARERLFALLRRTRPRHPVILSGDRHFGEISRMDNAEGGPLYDITSSGMTHCAPPEIANEPNEFRVGQAFAGYNFGLLLIDWSQPEPSVTMQVRDDKNAIRCEAVAR